MASESGSSASADVVNAALSLNIEEQLKNDEKILDEDFANNRMQNPSTTIIDLNFNETNSVIKCKFQ